MATRDYKIDFLRLRLPAVVISLLLISAGLIEIAKNGLRYSVDFTGGILVNLRFAEDTSVGEVRKSLATIDLDDSLIQEFGSHRDIVIRVAQEKAEKLVAKGTEQKGEVSVEVMLERLSLSIQDAIRQHFMKQTPPSNKIDFNNTGLAQLRNILETERPLHKGNQEASNTIDYEHLASQLYQARMSLNGLITSWDQLFKQVDIPEALKKYLKEAFYLGPFTIMQTEFVGPQVGRELKEKTRLAIVFALIGMLLYIWIRFDLVFGIAAVVCLIHDFLVTLSAFALTGREISLTVVAAFLTIIGYSLNDTIVVYDRIRENMGKRKYTNLYDLYNASMNQVLSRTLLTSLTTLFVVVVLFIFGGKVINDFAFALLVGIIVGTYSSIYVASSLSSYWQEYRRKAVAATVKKGRKVKTAG